MDYDYGIIGGGPAGYTAGMLLAKQGRRVVLFEKNGKLGGTCLHRGCIPTKSLIHSSEQYKEILKASEIGLDLKISNFDFSKVIEKRNQTVEKIQKSLELAVKNAGVNIVFEEAKIKDKNNIETAEKIYSVDKIIYAAGSKPRDIKGFEADGKFILNSDDILKMNKLPNNVLIIGSGAIGIEWARIFDNFGVEVIVVELAEHLIPLADIDVSKRVERIFKQNKIKFYTNNLVTSIEDGVVTLKTGEQFTPDIVLSAIGRVPNSIDMEGITVLGDACGEIQLAHYGIHQAKEFATGIPFDKEFVPSVIYGTPEIAWVGKREQDCIEGEYKTIMLPITALGKSWCDDCTDGFIKLITESEFIVGAHIISREASALIHELLIGIQKRITIDEMKELCFAHPTYSEGIFEALMRI